MNKIKIIPCICYSYDHFIFYHKMKDINYNILWSHVFLQEYNIVKRIIAIFKKFAPYNFPIEFKSCYKKTVINIFKELKIDVNIVKDDSLKLWFIDKKFYGRFTIMNKIQYLIYGYIEKKIEIVYSIDDNEVTITYA